MLEDVFLETSRATELWRWCELALDGVSPVTAPQERGEVSVVMAAISDALGKGARRRSQLLSDAEELFGTSGDKSGIARAKIQKGLHLAFHRRIEEARPHLSEALSLAREAGNRRLMARAIASSRYIEEDVSAQRSLLRDAIARYRAAGDTRNVVRILSWLAEVEFQIGNVEAALQHVDDAISLGRRTRDSGIFFITALMNSAAYHVWSGNIAEARASAREGIALVRELQMLQDLVFGVQFLASVSAASGDHVRAARLLGFVDARLLQMDESRQLTEKMLYDRLMASLREQANEEEIATLLAEGSNLSEEEAIEEALAV